MLSDAARSADEELAEVAESYDLLTLLQPSNLDEAWEAFRSSGFEREPPFEYPEIDLELKSVRERLNRIRLSDSDDAALLYLLTAKRDELDLELRLLDLRGTSAFLAASIRLFGPVQQELARKADKRAAGSLE